MSNYPLAWLEGMPERLRERVRSVIVHCEISKRQLDMVAKYVEDKLVNFGIAVNPKTPVYQVWDIVEGFRGSRHSVDGILIMTVEPGFGGQSFIESDISKSGNKVYADDKIVLSPEQKKSLSGI